SSRGTSKRAVTSAEGRGTGGYRAPELVMDSSSLTFTNKVDIWGLGCVLYELATGKRAFKYDWNIRDYYMSRSPLKPSITGLPNILQCHLDEMAQELLHRDQQLRPRVSELLPIFESYLEIMHHSAQQTFHRIPIGPSYPEWKRIVQRCPNRSELRPLLNTWFRFTGAVNAAMPLYKEAVARNPLDEKCIRQFKAACAKNNDI